MAWCSRMNFLDWLGVLFGFRDDNVQNQGECLVFHFAKLSNVPLYAAEDRRLPWLDHSLELSRQAPHELHFMVLISWPKILGNGDPWQALKNWGVQAELLTVFITWDALHFLKFVLDAGTPIHLAVVLEYLATKVLKLLENAWLVSMNHTWECLYF